MIMFDKNSKQNLFMRKIVVYSLPDSITLKKVVKVCYFFRNLLSRGIEELHVTIRESVIYITSCRMVVFFMCISRSARLTSCFCWCRRWHIWGPFLYSVPMEAHSKSPFWLFWYTSVMQSTYWRSHRSTLLRSSWLILISIETSGIFYCESHTGWLFLFYGLSTTHESFKSESVLYFIIFFSFSHMVSFIYLFYAILRFQLFFWQSYGINYIVWFRYQFS